MFDAGMQQLTLGVSERIFFIGEIGINHNGDMGAAKRLIDMAKNAGCDAVKFQKRTIDIVYTPEFLAQQRESPWGTTQREQKEGLEFSEAQYDEIDAYCRERGIEWFASAWDIPSLHFLRKYNLKYNKLASAMTTNIDFVREVASERKMTFISVGMCEASDIDAVVSVMREQDCPFVLMHTVSIYPAKEEELNLLSIDWLRKRYNCPVGYSGHEVSTSPSVIASMLGIVALERHITLNRAMYGSDQAASLEGPALERLIAMIRKIPIVLGKCERCISEKEKNVAKKLRYWVS